VRPQHEKIDFWDNVYGFDFSCIKGLAMTEPLVDCVDPGQVATNTTQLMAIDIHSMQKTDTTFKVKWWWCWWWWCVCVCVWWGLGLVR
jgi:protein arginine N-methyltransferase 1